MALFVSGPGGLCVGPLSGPNAVCVGARSLGGASALRSVLEASLNISLYQAQGLSVYLGPALSVSGPGAFCRCRDPVVLSQHCLCQGPGSLWGGARCRVPALAARIRVPPIRQQRLVGSAHATHPAAGPQLRSACHPSSLARSLFQERIPNLTGWGIIIIVIAILITLIVVVVAVVIATVIVVVLIMIKS